MKVGEGSLILNSPFAKPTRFWDFDSKAQKLFPAPATKRRIAEGELARA